MAYISLNKTDGSDAFEGTIAFGSLIESFIAASSRWSISEYYSHWIETLTRAIQLENVCIVTSWSPDYEPSGISGEMWCIYWLDNDRVVLQNKIILNRIYASNTAAIDPSNLSPGPHESVDEDGDLISEWQGTAEDLKSMLASVPQV